MSARRRVNVKEIEDSILSGVEETDQILGIGSYGSVFLGFWHGQRIAIKRLHAQVMGIDESTGKPSKQYEDFMREYPTLSRLSHPSVVEAYGMVRPKMRTDSHGLVMEFLPMTLKKRYGQTPFLTADEEVDITLAVACGLEYLHSRGVIHRDLTTRNIMMTKAADGKAPVKITDAGVARALEDPTRDVQTMTSNPGASNYMAPETQDEMVSHLVKYGRPVDIFALGLCITAMTTRQEPPTQASCKDTYIGRMRADHPLRALVMHCVKTLAVQRPSASKLCASVLSIVSQRQTSTANSDIPEQKPSSVDADTVALRREITGLRQQRGEDSSQILALQEKLEKATADLVQAMGEVNQLGTKNDRQSIEISQAHDQLDKAKLDLDIFKARHDEALASITAERENAVAKCDTALEERDAALATCKALSTERDLAVEACMISSAAHARGVDKAPGPERNPEVVERDSRSFDQDTAIAERDEAIMTVTRSLAERTNELKELDNTVVRIALERNNAYAQLNIVMAKNKDLFDELNRLECELDTAMCEKDRHRQQLHTAQQELYRFRSQVLYFFKVMGSVSTSSSSSDHTPSGTSHPLLESASAGLFPNRQQIVCNSQLQPGTVPSSHVGIDHENGTVARCQRLFSSGATIPPMILAPQWIDMTSSPKGARYRCQQPCFHGDFLYCSFEMESTATAALYRISAGDLGILGGTAWQTVTLPDIQWQVWSALFFSLTDQLYAIFSSVESSSDHAVFCLSNDSHWQPVSRLPKRGEDIAATLFESTLVVLVRSACPSSGPESCTWKVRTLDLCNAGMDWVPLQDLPCDCENLDAIAHDSFLHVFTGKTSVACRDRSVLSMDMRLAADKRVWCERVLPPVPGEQYTAAVMNGYVVVSTNSSNSPLSVGRCDVLLYIPECRQYLPLPPLKDTVCADCCFSHNNLLFAFTRDSKGRQRLQILSV